MKRAAIYGLVAAATVGTSTYLMQPPTDIKTYVHGGLIPHDIYYAAQVDSDTDIGLYCRVDVAELTTANPGDVVISMRENSAACGYKSTALDTIAVVGWDNSDLFVGDVGIDNALVISNGSNYGHAIDYYIPESSLSAAMPATANIVLAINNARINAGMTLLDTSGIKAVLDESSDEIKQSDDVLKYYGQIIDLDQAILIATTPTSTPVACGNCAFLPAIYTLLLGD